MIFAQNAWKELSSDARIYAEASMQFHSLFAIDPEEATSNLDRAFSAKLEAFHRLYDVTKGSGAFEYFRHADTSLVIALRNALHHKDHTLFRSWNAWLLESGGAKANRGGRYALGNYPGFTEDTSRYYLKLQDFYTRLTHPTVPRAEQLKRLWDAELGFTRLASAANEQSYEVGNVYVNCIPIFISAMCRASRWLQAAGMAPTGFDGDTYFRHFSRMEEPDLRQPSITQLLFPED